MLPLLERYLRSVWEDLPGAGPRPSTLSLLPQGTGVSKVCYFVFADGEPLPSYIVKLPRSPFYNEGLEREVKAIEGVRASVSRELQATLPGPMRSDSLAGHMLVVEPVLPGRPMDAQIIPGTRLDRSLAAASMSRAREWLVQVQRESPNRRGPLDRPSLQKHFLEPLDVMARESDLTPSEEAYLERVRETAVGLEGQEIPLFLYHGDFRPGNILVGDDRISVLDWEFSRPLAPPFLDWFSFVFRLYSRSIALPDIDGPLTAYKKAFADVFFGGNWFSSLVAEETERYCQALGVSHELVPLLFSLFVATNVNKFYGFLAERAGRGYLYLLQDSPASLLPYGEQLRRQAYVFLWGDLAENPESLVFFKGRKPAGCLP